MFLHEFRLIFTSKLLFVGIYSICFNTGTVQETGFADKQFFFFF